jgi:hypothetical protein
MVYQDSLSNVGEFFTGRHTFLKKVVSILEDLQQFSVVMSVAIGKIIIF